MRVTLIIFSLIGVCVIALLVVIGTGLVHLSSLDALAANPGVPSATQPTTDSDDIDTADPDLPDTGPAAVDATQSYVVDRSVFLAAADATITGPKIALMLRDNVVLKTGDGQPPPVIPPDVVEPGRGGHGARGGGHRRPPPPPFLAKWFGPDDRAEWSFVSPAAGRYTVSFVYSGPPSRQDSGKKGGPFVVSAGSAEIVAAPKPTTNGSSFEMTDVGELTLPAGPIQLTVRPQGKVTYDTSIRLRSVRLFPSKE